MNSPRKCQQNSQGLKHQLMTPHFRSLSLGCFFTRQAKFPFLFFLPFCFPHYLCAGIICMFVCLKQANRRKFASCFVVLDLKWRYLLLLSLYACFDLQQQCASIQHSPYIHLHTVACEQHFKTVYRHTCESQFLPHKIITCNLYCAYMEAKHISSSYVSCVYLSSSGFSGIP